MSQIYQERRRAETAPPAQTLKTAVPDPSVQELAAGARPTEEQMGSRVDLPDAIREKMESSFGADFSNVRLFESDTVAEAGAEAVTQGSNIAFAPGKLDLTSTAGQALLGHELSHVVSQARGESAGRGFLNDAHLEAQADRQGMMAAQGESVYLGPVTPIGTSSAVSAAGPMQAKKKDKNKEQKGIADKAFLSGAQIDTNFDDLKKNDYETEDDFIDYYGYHDDDDFVTERSLRRDLRNMTRQMSAFSPNLVNEDFATRADAYAHSKITSRQLEAFEGIGIDPSELLNEEEAAAFNTAKGNFLSDRKNAGESMEATRNKSYNSRKNRRNRNKYWKARRKEIAGE